MMGTGAQNQSAMPITVLPITNTTSLEILSASAGNPARFLFHMIIAAGFYKAFFLTVQKNNIRMMKAAVLHLFPTVTALRLFMRMTDTRTVFRFPEEMQLHALFYMMKITAVPQNCMRRELKNILFRSE